jgi:hypothetical protein
MFELGTVNLVLQTGVVDSPWELVEEESWRLDYLKKFMFKFNNINIKHKSTKYSIRVYTLFKG